MRLTRVQRIFASTLIFVPWSPSSAKASDRQHRSGRGHAEALQCVRGVSNAAQRGGVDVGSEVSFPFFWEVTERLRTDIKKGW